jgi:ribosomal protein L21E
MATRKSRLSRAQRKDALAQLQSYRQENEQEMGHSQNKRPEVSNSDLLSELKQEQREAKRNKKVAKRQARSDVRHLREEEGPRVKISFANAYSPGDLVSITKRACKRCHLEDYYNLYEGAMGVIVEQEDQYSYQGKEEARYVQVMGPNGLEKWDVRWCTHLEEDED